MTVSVSRPLILASTSPYRRALLERAGLPFSCDSPRIEESDWAARCLPPEQLARELAIAKGKEVASRHPGAVVIAGDQVAFLQEKILGKPGSEERAMQQLRMLAGRTHTLTTAVAILENDEMRSHVDITHLTMRSLTEDEIDRYVRKDRPIDCCGAYKIESLGVSLFEAIETRDHTAIMGLPMLFICNTLRQMGFDLP